MSFRHRIFDSPSFIPSREPWKHQAWDALTNGYFSVQNQVLFNDFWTELIAAQDALLALGAAYFDPQTVRSIFRNQQAAVFLNLAEARTGVCRAGRGWLHSQRFSQHPCVLAAALGRIEKAIWFRAIRRVAPSRQHKTFCVIRRAREGIN